MKHAIHLIQSANTLRAEINIASQATIIRRQGTTDPIVDANELINCSGFGLADRHSDPHIGDVVNGVARQGSSITLQDPIGLYIESLPDPTNDLGIKKPGGGSVGDGVLEATDPWRQRSHLARRVRSSSRTAGCRRSGDRRARKLRPGARSSRLERDYGSN